jgi:hypothetical protein
MEFKIIEDTKEKRHRKPYYEVDIEYMIGDADGEEHEIIEFMDKPKDVKKMKVFILAIAGCCAAYPNGRTGSDEYGCLPEYDAIYSEEYNDDNLPEYDNEEDLNYYKKYRALEIYLDHPYDHNCDCGTTIRDYIVYYYDNNGDRYEVEIDFSIEELNRIEYCKTYFD